MAKFCTNCGNELADNAAMCVNCGKMVEGGNNINSSNNGGKKKKGLPTWAIVLIVVGCVILIPLIIIVILGVIGYNAVKDSDVDIDDYINESKTDTIVGTIGDTLTCDDFKLTLTDALMYSSIEGEYFTDTPAEGKEFLVFFFDVENIDDENEYISSYDFSGYVDDYSVNNKYLFNSINGVEDLSMDLASGMKVKGYVAFEVDTTWKNFEVHFDSYNFDDDKKLVFKVVNEDDSNNKGA